MYIARCQFLDKEMITHLDIFGLQALESANRIIPLEIIDYHKGSSS